MLGAIPPLPHMTSWSGTWLSIGTSNLPIYFSVTYIPNLLTN